MTLKEMKMIKTFCVTGNSGFIGSNLTEELLKQGYSVIGIDNLATGKLSNMDSFKDHPNFRFIQDDIRNKNLHLILEGVDTIFHTAALARIQPSITNPEEYHDVNVNGTLNVLQSAIKAGVRRIVYSASSSAYGIQETMPETEDMPPRPLNPYATQKYIGELLMRTWANCYPIETVSLRYFNVFGKNQVLDGAYATVIGIFLQQNKEGKPLTIVGDGTQKRDITWIGDVVRANILASQSDKVGKGEVINIGTGKNYSINEISKIVGGENVKTISAKSRQFEVKETLADISKAKELLRWKSEVDLKTGINLLKDLTN